MKVVCSREEFGFCGLRNGAQCFVFQISFNAAPIVSGVIASIIATVEEADHDQQWVTLRSGHTLFSDWFILGFNPTSSL